MADTKVIVIPEGKICDYVDGKFRNDTPEEYVRQTIEKRLVNEHKYNKDYEKELQVRARTEAKIREIERRVREELEKEEREKASAQA